MVGPLRPLITPWSWALWAAAAPHSNRRVASDRVTTNAIALNLFPYMNFLSCINVRSGILRRHRLKLEFLIENRRTVPGNLDLRSGRGTRSDECRHQTTCRCQEQPPMQNSDEIRSRWNQIIVHPGPAIRHYV